MKAEFKDAYANILKNYIEVIKKGISGTLTNVEKLDLENFAASIGFEGKLDFVETKEGLQLA